MLSHRACLRAFSVGALLLAATSVPLRAQPPLAPGEVLVERTFLPDAKPSSFAFGLPGGVNFCYDPIRGGVNYAWTGGFLDLTNLRPAMGKLIKAAQLLGPVVYRETGPAPLRRGDPKKTPVVEFKGYTLGNGFVEIRYLIDDTPIREKISALPDHSGLTRTFSFDRSGADAKWWYVTTGHAATTVTPDATGTFTLTTRFDAQLNTPAKFAP
jgi:hypothetical protein